VRAVTIVAAIFVFTIGFGSGAQAEDGVRSEEAGSFALVNAARSDAGPTALVRDARLDGVARANAARMVARNAVAHDHDLPAHVNATGVVWRSLGENVGVGPDVQMIHDSFTASEGHRNNMLKPAYNAIGVGVAHDDGRIYVAHVFAEVVRAARPASTVSVHAQRATPPVQTPARRARSLVVRRPSVDPNALVGGVVTR
jgi:uncharacterized protein YkwD